LKEKRAFILPVSRVKELIFFSEVSGVRNKILFTVLINKGGVKEMHI